MGEKEQFIADMYPAAVQISKETGMSWELILAQAAQETGWGQHQLEGTNNIFNIKADAGWDGPSKTFNVWEIEGGKKVWKDQDFRVYGSTEEALRDRVEFLKDNPRYAKAGLFDEGVKGNFEKEAEALQKAGYATDPKYAESLVSVFNGPTMRRAIAQAGQDVQAPASVQPASVQPAVADGLLQKGEKGEEIRQLQEQLNRLGQRDADGNALKADGDFGKHTREAVEAFQQTQGLQPVDGIVGPKTVEALKKAGQEPLLSDPRHPDHAMYNGAVQELEKLGPQAGFKNRQELEQAAGSMVFEARASGMTRIDHVVPSVNGNGLFAVQGELGDPAHQRVYADRAQAAAQPLQQSTQQLQQLEQDGRQQQTKDLQQAPQQDPVREAPARTMMA